MTEKAMPQHQAPQKLASYQSLIATWRRERNNAIKESVIPMILVVLVMTCIRAIVPMYVPLVNPMPGWTAWIVASVIMAAGIAWPLVMAKSGPKPTPADVERNRELRRAFGMDDSIEDDSE